MDHSAEEWALDGGHHGDNGEHTDLAPDPDTDHLGNHRPCDAEATLGCELTVLYLP